MPALLERTLSLPNSVGGSGAGPNISAILKVAICNDIKKYSVTIELISIN